MTTDTAERRVAAYSVQTSLDEAETLMVASFFGMADHGFFVEVGANEPRLRSQTWHLERANWNGILIEPQPALASRLRAERRSLVVEAACSSPSNAGRAMPLYVAGPLSSLDRLSMAPGAIPSGTVAVPVRTLDEILTENGAPERFEFLSIDVEGHELEVLRGLSLQKWRPRLVLLEDHVSDLRAHRHMRTHGYKIIRRYGNNGWYTPIDFNHSPSFSEAAAIIRKYYLALPFRKLRNLSRLLRKKSIRMKRL